MSFHFQYDLSLMLSNAGVSRMWITTIFRSCAPALLIEREYRLSPGTSTTRVEWTSQAAAEAICESTNQLATTGVPILDPQSGEEVARFGVA